MAKLGEIQFRGDGSDPKQVFNYMLQLEEQIKYALAHIGEENIEPGSIEMEQFGPVMKQSVQQITFDIEREQAKSRQLASEDGRLRTLIITTEQGIMAQMEDLQQGLENEIQITAAGLTERIENSEGDITQLKTRATGLETRVTDAEGNITTFQEMADAIGLSATGIDFDEATGNPTIKGSYFTIDKDGIDILSTGALTINTTNFKLYANGTALFGGTLTAPSGNIGGLYINNNALSTYDDSMIFTANTQDIGGGSSIVLRQNANRSGLIFSADTFTGMTIIKNLYLWDPNAPGPSGGTGNWVDVTSAILALL